MGHYQARESYFALPPLTGGEFTRLKTVPAAPESTVLVNRVHEAFKKASSIYLCFNHKIGDTVFFTSVIEGMRQLQERGEEKHVTLIAPEAVMPILLPFSERYGFDLITAPEPKHTELAAKQLSEMRGDEAPVIFEFGFDPASGGYTDMEDFRGGVVISNLVYAGTSLYTNARSGNQRFADFFYDLTGEHVVARPKVYMPANEETIKAALRAQYGFDKSKQQVGIILEASEERKRYPISHWQEVMSQIAQAQPDTEFNLFVHESYTDTQLEVLQQIIDKPVRIIRQPLERTIVALSMQQVCLGNDSGLTQIASNVDSPNPRAVISLHFPDYTPDVWVTNSDRQEGIMPPKGSYEHLMGRLLDETELKEAENLMGKIDPSVVTKLAVNKLGEQGGQN